LQTEHSLGLKCDVTSEQDIEVAIETVKRTFGRLDTLVNNAGIVMPGRTQEVGSSDFNKIFDVHLVGSFRFCRAAYPLLMKSEIASIINVSSVSAQRTAPGRASYNSAKAALEGLTRTLAVEWAPVGIRVNAVAPGFVLTDSARSVYDSGAANLEQRLRFIPMGRTGEPHEIGEAIAWLASNKASYITGQIVAVDGGFLVDGRTGGDSWAT
jgi:NAD(P)-dependent dehydrogenase (short-subunit alcohol dehydrogenase family)